MDPGAGGACPINNRVEGVARAGVDVAGLEENNRSVIKLGQQIGLESPLIVRWHPFYLIETEAGVADCR
jgi:hypothetical protein